MVYDSSYSSFIPVPARRNLWLIRLGLHGSLESLVVSFAQVGNRPAYDLQLLQISLSSSIDPPHGFLEGVSNILNILHRPLVMSEND